MAISNCLVKLNDHKCQVLKLHYYYYHPKTQTTDFKIGNICKDVARKKGRKSPTS